MRTSKPLALTLAAGAWGSVAILLLIGLFMLLKSAPFFAEAGVLPLWQDSAWAPTEGLFNLVPMLVGSLVITAGAVLLAAPTGVLLAVFGRYYAPPWLASFYRGLVELLSGIPSVVYGFWGLIVLVPLISQLVPPGASVLAGCIVLALMVLPLVVLAADTGFAQIPDQWLAAADALALHRWSKIRRIVLPQTMPTILSGVTLQTGRALGETMAVLMVCGNIVQIPTSPFEPARTLTANIALEMAYATGNHVHALFVSGLLLLLLTVGLVWLGSHFQGRLKGQHHG